MSGAELGERCVEGMSSIYDDAASHSIYDLDGVNWATCFNIFNKEGALGGTWFGNVRCCVLV